MKKKIWINILLVIFICAFLYSGYNVFIWLKSDKETKELEEGLYSEVITENKEEPENDLINVDFNTLRNTNSDIIGWIRIKDTYINYPILQGETDEYYLKKDIYKNFSLSGSIFVDSKANANFEDANTVIYGHNMKNARMFANLHKINNGTLGTDVNVEIYTNNGCYIYKVFASSNFEPTFDTLKKNFANQEDKINYINEAIRKSKVKFDMNKDNINYENNIITLITCDSSSNRRVVVNAVKID